MMKTLKDQIHLVCNTGILLFYHKHGYTSLPKYLNVVEEHPRARLNWFATQSPSLSDIACRPVQEDTSGHVHVSNSHPGSRVQTDRTRC